MENAINRNMKIAVINAPPQPVIKTPETDGALPLVSHTYNRTGPAPKPFSEMGLGSLPHAARTAIEKWNRFEIQLCMEESMDACKRQFIEGKRDNAKAVVLEAIKRHPPYSNKLNWYAVAAQFGYATPEQVVAVRDLIAFSYEVHANLIKSGKGVVDGLDPDFLNKAGELDSRRDGLTTMLSDMTQLDRNCGDAAVLAIARELIGVIDEMKGML